MKRPVILLDLDGVLVKDKALNPFPDTHSFLNGIRSLNIPFRVVSNNSTRPPKKILEELKNKGIELREDEFISPLSILGDYLKEKGIKRVFFIGMPVVREYLLDLGFEVLEDYRVDAVVIAQDRSIDFKKLKLATSAVFLNGARIVPVNLSRIVKDDDGLYFPVVIKTVFIPKSFAPIRSVYISSLTRYTSSPLSPFRACSINSLEGLWSC